MLRSLMMSGMVAPVEHRFEIWLIQLDPTQGSEIRKTRCCVMLSTDEMISLKTVIIESHDVKIF